MKKSIIIYADCIAILEELTYEQAGKLFKAILAYVNDEPVTETEGDPAVKMAYKVLKTQIDRDAEKYEEICKKRSEYGKRHKGNQYTRINELKDKLEQMEQKFQIGTNGTDSDSENDSDSDSDSELPNGNNNILAPNGASSSHDDSINFDGLVLFFNSTLKKYNSVICQIKDIKGKRRDSVKARSRERGKKSLAVVFENAAKSDFLNGKNDRGFIANFDWLIRPNNFIKVLEGNYDNPNKAIQSSPTTDSDYDTENIIEKQKKRSEEDKKRILEVYEKAKNGDKRCAELVEMMRKTGKLAMYGLE